MNRTMWIFVLVNTIGSVEHHVDHALRHKVGWPLTDRVTIWTYSLGIYVFLLVGAILSRRRVVGPNYWAVMGFVGFAFIAFTHYGPGGGDPASAFAADYGSQLKATVALTAVWLFLCSLAASAVYSARRSLVIRAESARATS